ncbi:helix-turn-helix transcriptional regulator [Clostridium perfringens]|uniref:helix-turn-helix domain-containing protein n=1 Tax=Clostridium perfringens TaxID=1502 RepID=UPI0018E45453|nr:helix-turn-helix transcriptional regulator [Clostridium perfringens]MBI6029285.1 helix-turn-helix transcriptional regulator [Clostridium perfringens]MBI6033649.1 helix-turn-helix transcriptional regulator [Clostridium perfringens]MDK0667687.1 helix-turn-helix transcriptional regulator [Clostridium perfringens]
MINNKFSVLLGERLIKITEISDRTGISRTTLTNLYYKRSKFISFDVLNKLCEFFDCSVEDIIEFKK